jgi:hypothetical protein
MVYGNGVVIAVGANGLMLSSTNQGTTWTNLNSVVGVNLDSIAYGNGRFVATGQSGAVITSTNNGTNWSVNWNGYSYYGNGQSVVYGNGYFVLGNGAVSYDGSEWNLPSYTNPFSTPWGGSALSMAYGNVGFISVSDSSALQSVPSGVPQYNYYNNNWSQPVAGNVAAAYSDASLSTVFTSDTNYLAFGLPTGLSVTPSGIISGTPTQEGTFSASVYPVNAIGAGPNYQATITINPTGTNSPSPVNFVSRFTGNLQTQIQAVASGSAVYIGYSTYNGNGPDTTVAVSSNGLNWTDSVVVPGQNYQTYALASGGGLWMDIVSGYGSGCQVFTSQNNGNTWNQVSTVTPPASQFYNLNLPYTSLTYANGIWVLAGSGYNSGSDSQGNYTGQYGYQGAVWRSADGGVTWSNTWSGPITQNWNGSGNGFGINALTYTNGTLIGVGANGLILSSTNKGATWNTNSSGVSVNLDSITYGNGRYIVGGDNGTILYSTNNGTNWNSEPVWLNGTTIDSLAFGNGVFLLGEGGWVSSDGIAWSQPSFNNYYPYQYLNSYNPNTLVFGSNGFISANWGGVVQSVSGNVPFIDYSNYQSLYTGATQGTAYTNAIKAKGATTFTAIGLPPGLSMNSIASSPTAGAGTNVVTTGVISGTPTQSGNYNVTVYASNAGGVGSYANFVINVNDPQSNSASLPPPWIISLPTGTTALTTNGGAIVNYSQAQFLGAISTNYSSPSGSYFPVGTNIVTVTGTGSDGQTTSTNFPVVVSSQPPWIQQAQAAASQQYSCLLYATVLNSNSLPVNNSNSILAVFSGSSVVGAAYPSPGPSNSMVFVPRVYSGSVTNSGLTFQVYDALSGTVTNIAESINFTNQINQGTIVAPVTLHEPQTMSIPIIAGWNWISFDVTSVDGTIGSLLRNYTPQNNDVIKGSNGFATYLNGVWYPSSSSFKIQPGLMYLLSSTQNTILTATGLSVPYPLTVSLVSGYNWIGYPRSTPSTFSQVFGSLNAVNNDFMYGQQWSDSFYGGTWYPNPPGNPQILPGQGYLLYVATPQQLSF